jgi:hypothetical protein
VSVHVDGPGSLDAGSGLTDANGEATFTYTAPDPFDGKNARVVATIADFNGTFSDTVGIGLRR